MNKLLLQWKGFNIGTRKNSNLYRRFKNVIKVFTKYEQQHIAKQNYLAFFAKSIKQNMFFIQI